MMRDDDPALYIRTTLSCLKRKWWEALGKKGIEERERAINEIAETIAKHLRCQFEFTKKPWKPGHP